MIMMAGMMGVLYLASMKLLSLNVGKPQAFSYDGMEGYTSIFKKPVEDERKVSILNIEGDEQSDLKNHGGELKAVYAYDVSHYDHWRNILERDDWSYGLFGENLTTEGLSDDTVLMGNVYQIGSVLLKAVQPRFPCFKLNIRFDAGNMVQQFVRQERNGIYFSVVEEGSLQVGDEIRLVEQSNYEVTIQQVVDSYYHKGRDTDIAAQILKIDFLPARLRQSFEHFMK
jgi:MOSC domain-containing protein YiiM